MMQYDIKPGIKGLIFDFDGTLADTMPIHYKAWKIASKKFGLEMDAAFFKKNAGMPGWALVNEILKKSSINSTVTIDQILIEKNIEYSKEDHLIKPILPVVKIVKKYHGVLPMAIGTGGQRKDVERTLKMIGLRKYFDIIITANDLINFKPHPETFLKCAELMKIDPELIEVFEDGDLGIEAALEAGMVPTDVRSWYDSDWEV
jgi:beta-phosphoglucomutase family hydrolase